jgi:hypothetical protein
MRTSLIALWLVTGAVGGAADPSPVLVVKHQEEAVSVAFSPDGKVLAAGSGRSGILFWDAATGRVLRRIEGADVGDQVAYSPDGKTLVSTRNWQQGEAGGVVHFWQAATGRPRGFLRGDDNLIRCVAFSPDGKRLAAHSQWGAWRPGAVRVWELSTGKEVLHVPTNSAGHTIAFSPDGKLLAFDVEYTVRLCRADTGKELFRLQGHQEVAGRARINSGYVNALAFSSDGKLLASASCDGTARIWDVATGKALRVLEGHRGFVDAVLFLPGGEVLATGGEDGTIRLWEAATGRQRRGFRAHGGSARPGGDPRRDVFALALSPDGRRLASAGRDGAVKVWEVAGLLARAGKSADPGQKADQKSRPRFTVSKETTYITGPVDADGYIDYAAALNKRLGEGIRPTDNANVLLWKAIGPRPEGATVPAEYFELLGVKPPPEKGEYLGNLYAYLKERLKADPDEPADKAVDDQMDRASQRPWTARQYPHIAAWLKANDRPLAVAVEATRRPQYFSPLVPKQTKQGPGGLLTALLPGAQKCRGLAQALATRAMLRVGEGRHDEAWQDLLACHRLGRLVARGGTLIETLIGIAIDAVADSADLAYLQAAKLEARTIKDRLRDLRKLQPMPPVADMMALTERFVFLDTVMTLNRSGINQLEALAVGKLPQPVAAEGKRPLENIDWDPALRNANRWFSRVAAAMRLKDRSLREQHLDRIERELKQLKASAGDWGTLARTVLAEGTPARARGKLIGDQLLCLLMPALRKVEEAHDRAEQLQHNLQVAFALAAYRREHGRYPKELAALAPDYLTTVPPDLFSGKALVYRPGKDGYLLYSVGVNGRDEQGRSYEDDPPGDDLTVRMPLPRRSRP